MCLWAIINYFSFSLFSCLDSHDKIIVYDGKDSSQRILKTFCDSHNLELVNSSGPYMYIEFRSDRRHEKQGFAAEYHFIDKDSYFTRDGRFIRAPDKVDF